MNLLTLLIGGLATWRLSHAIVKEAGPLMCFMRLRARLARIQKRSGGFFDAVSCVYCLSFWIGLIAALFASSEIFHIIGYALAFSAIASIIEAVLANNPNAFTLIAPPTTDTKVTIRGRTTPKQGNDVVGHPNTPDGYSTVETPPSLDN